MLSYLSSWLRREVRSGRRSRRSLPARRLPCKPWLEVLEDRNVLSGWTTETPMPTPRGRLAAATGFDGRIYAIGGGSNIGYPLDTYFSDDRVEAYTPWTKTWSTMAEMKVGRKLLAAATGFNGHIYAIGGDVEGTFFSPTNDVEEYIPGTNHWYPAPSMSTKRAGLAAVTAPDNLIYAIGGDDDGGNVLNTVEAYSLITHSWSPVGSMSTARYGAAAAVGPDGRIYVFGGRDSTGPLSHTVNTVEAYSLITHSWSPVASMPTTRSFAAAAAWGSGQDRRLLVFGGQDAMGNPLNTVESYNPNTNSWSPEFSMPTARDGLAGVNFKGDIFAIGGFNGHELDTVELLSGPPAGPYWSSAPSMTTDRDAPAVGVDIADLHGRRFYAIGGKNGGGYLNTVEAYSPGPNLWNPVASMSTGRAGLAAAGGLDGRIYAFGGTPDDVSALDLVEAYSPSLNRWSMVTPMTTARSGLAGAGGSDGRIYALGGFNPSSGYLHTVEAYSPGRQTWSSVASMSSARYGAAAAVGMDDRIYVFGGSPDGRTVLNTVEVYSPGLNRWSRLTSMITAREFPAAARGPNGRLYVIGGFDAMGTPLDTVESYNPNTNSWSREALMATARGGLAAALGIDGHIYAFGGFNPTSGFLKTMEALQSFGGFFGGAASAAKSPTVASGDPPIATPTIITPVLDASNQWAGSGNSEGDTALRARTDVVFAAGADTLSENLADALWAGGDVS
jgi:N-acetylneuraminic acid mutarotase